MGQTLELVRSRMSMRKGILEGTLWTKAGGRKVQGKFKEFSSIDFHQYLPGHTLC